jgi:hypothetical protein
MGKLHNLDQDAFSSGQIGSKLWLCEELEKLKWRSNLTHVYAGWYGITSFLLLSRGKFKVNKIESYDFDPTCQPVADMINENWVWQNWRFKAYTQDCNTLNSSRADLIINTSTEHFDSLLWWNYIPDGTRVVLQGNNMPHEDHCIHSETLEDFCNNYPVSEVVYAGQKEFVYPNWSFTRFMLIGIK